MKSIFKLSILLASAAILSAQNKIDQTTIDRTTTTPPKSVTSSGDGSGNVAATDSGAQRPIFLNTKLLSAFAGYDGKITYRSNPLTLPGDMKQAKTGIWQNSFFGGASLSPIDTDIAVVTPFFGGGWTMSDYLNDNLSTLNDYATSAYGLLMIQHESGWGFRGGVSYANVRNNDTDSEDYSEFYPNIGAMTTYALNPDTLAIIDFSWGYHLSKSDSLLGGNTQSLNNWDAAFSYSLRHSYGDFVITPNYRLGYKRFTEDGTVNDGRKDVMHTLSIKVDYPVADNLKLSANTSYSRRNSSGGAGTDYKNFDAGATVSINISF
jgi:hypothetical protein